MNIELTPQELVRVLDTLKEKVDPVVKIIQKIAQQAKDQEEKKEG